MRPRRLEIQAFRGWREPVSFDLSAPITMFVGENRSGKSSATNAIEWCLYGSLVEKRSPGLEERADWEVRPRQVDDLDTVVTVTFEDDADIVEITRRRPTNAKGRNPDQLSVRVGDEAPLEGDAAERWLQTSALPPWEDYRRAHCFHQEAARTRVVDSNDRSTVLAALLGLEEDLLVRDAIQAQTKTSLIKEVDGILAATERTLFDRLAHPGKEVEQAVRSLEERGITRTHLTAELPQEVRTRMVERAREVARRLEFDVTLPRPDDPDAFATWAREWPSTLDRTAGAAKRVEALLREHGRLQAARSAAEPAQAALRTARKKRDEALEQGGNEEVRTARLREAETAREAAARALQRTSRLTALLKDARPLVADDADPPACPVCATSVPALGRRIDEALAGLESEEVTRLTRARDAAEAAVKTRQRELELVRAVQRDERQAAESHKTKRAGLGRSLGLDPDETDHDLVAAAAARLAEIVEEGQELRRLETAQRDARTDHQDDLDLLRDLNRWSRLRVAAERVVDLDALAGRPALDASLDAAAAFAADVEALAGMARAAQVDRSASRQAEVNESLCTYYDLITGDASKVRVHVHATAKRLTYKLVDETDRSAVPVLNQAALNALSLAMLFAQAETRARAGGLDFVVLDDPDQSLDQARQEGLARAVARLAETCAVVLASTPTHLVDQVRTTVSMARREHRLAPWDPATGSRIEQTESL